MDDLAAKFPESLPEFQRMFPDDWACARYLERVRWREGSVAPSARHRRADAARSPAPAPVPQLQARRSLTAGTIMDRTHTPLSTWFWSAYLVCSLTPGMSAVQLQRQLGLSRYETLSRSCKSCALACPRPRSDWRTRRETRRGRRGVGRRRDHGQGRGVHNQACVIAAVEVRQRKVGEPSRDGHSKAKPRRGGRYAGRLRLSMIPDRIRRRRALDSSSRTWSQQRDALSPTGTKVTRRWPSAATNTSRCPSVVSLTSPRTTCRSSHLVSRISRRGSTARTMA